MRIENKIFYGVWIQVVALFLCAMFGTFLSDYLSETNWFGDYYEIWYEGTGYEQVIDKWGTRRIWYMILCGILFLSGIVRIILWAVFTKQKHDDKQ